MFRIATRFPREKRVLFSVRRLVATASGPALIICRVVSCWALRFGRGARFGWLMLAFDRVLVVRQRWIDGYRDFSLMRASWVVKRQSTRIASRLR